MAAAAAPPPSYDEVVKDINQKLGDSPTPTKVLDVAKGLSEVAANVIVDHDKKLPELTNDQKKSFVAGLEKTLSSEDAVTYAEESAAKAAESVDKINKMFQTLSTALSAIDTIYDQGFSSELQKHKEVWPSISTVKV